MGLKKVCTDCGVIIDYNTGYLCDSCNSKRYKDKYDHEKSNHKRLYHTKRWQRLRRNIMAKYNWLCLPSLEQGLIVEAKILHHIEEANENNFYDKDNLIPLSFNMHEEVHRRYDKSKESKKECQEWLKRLKDTPLQDKI
jgi:hypothetical protein